MANLNKIQVWSNYNFFKKTIDLTRCYTHYNCSVSLHAHTFLEINIISEGSGTHHIYNTDINVKRGDVFIIPPNTPHSYKDLGGLTVRHILIADDFFTKNKDELDKISNYDTLFNVQSFLPYQNTLTTISEKDFETLNDFWEILIAERLDDDRPENRTDEQCILSNSIVLSLIVFICVCCGRSGRKSELSLSKQDLSLSKAIEYVSKHYDEKITAQNLADLCNMSLSSFSRNFRAIFKSSPIDYVISQRIAHAKILLKTDTMSIAEIAQTTGFFDSSHFTKTFVKCTGVLPIRYRSKK